MSTRNLDKMMTPGSVVAIGASARPGSLGEAVTRNLLAGGFQGEIHLVNIKGGEIAGRPVLKSLAELKQPADLAVIMTPPETVPRLVLELGERGTRVAVVITAGSGEDNARWRKRILRAARPHLLRIVGPNCIGYAAPRIGLNASFGPGQLKAGRIAAIAQSGAVLAGLADWGTAQNIGFSHLISMGDMSRRRLRRRFGHAGARLRHARRADVRRRHHPGAQVHVGRAQRRAHEAGDRAEGGPPCRRRQGRGLAHRRHGGIGRGLRRSLRARRLGARAWPGRAVRRRRDAGPWRLAAQRAAGHPDQRRRHRHHRHRPADGRGRRARVAPAAHARRARQGVAARLVARQSGRHRGRRRRCALRHRARRPGRRSRRGCGAGDERADGAHLVGRGGARRGGCAPAPRSCR